MTDEKVTNGEVVYEEVQDARTGEIIPKGSPAELRPGILAQININQVGTLEVGEEALKVLEEALDPNDVKIRPDGLVYLPWTWYNKKLNRAFGILKWGLIPQGSPQIKEMGNTTLIVWLNWLVVRGVPVSMAGGETSYQPKNFTMSYGDAVEGARSNSLARNCKNLGMAIELWDADWVENWKKEYAEKYPNPNQDSRTKYLWRKRNGHKAEKTEPAKATEPIERPAETTGAAVTEEVKAETEKKYTVKQLRDFNIVKAIAKQSEKKNSEVAAVINKLDEKTSYSISDVVKRLTGEQNATE